MALQTTTNIRVDFYDKKYILINAKQFDKKTRFLSVICYNHGELYPISSRDHAAYIRCKKSDEHAVFNFCEITEDGKILVELTEQMLASSGICVADLVIVNRGQAEVDTETGEIINIDRASVLSTMTFHIDVSETAVDNAQIESSYEYNAFNQSLETYWADFEEVMQTSKSYAVGNAGGIRPNENTDNAKYYYELALEKANISVDNAAAAAKSEENAKASEINASKSEANAKVYKENANAYMNNAEDYMEAAQASETKATLSEANASESAISAQDSMTAAANSASEAAEIRDLTFKYYNDTKNIKDSISGGFRPKGTLTFEELQSLNGDTIIAGDLYNISNAFETDDGFMESGIECGAGTNVYYTVDGKWSCLAGITDITAGDVGAIAITDIATVDEIKTYLGID